MAIGWTDRDPTAGVRGYKSKKIHNWRNPRLSSSSNVGPKAPASGSSLRFSLYAQRGFDVYHMIWADRVGDIIRVAQQKTAANLTIPIHSALTRILAIADDTCDAILGQPIVKAFQ